MKNYGLDKLDSIAKQIEKQLTARLPQTIFTPTRVRLNKSIRSSIPVVTGKTKRTYKTIRHPSVGDYKDVIIGGSKNLSLAFLNPTQNRSLNQVKALAGFPMEGKFFLWDKNTAKSTKAKRSAFIPQLRKWADFTKPRLNIEKTRGVWVGRPSRTHWGRKDNLWFDKGTTSMMSTLERPLRTSMRKMLKTIKKGIIK